MKLSKIKAVLTVAAIAGVLALGGCGKETQETPSREVAVVESSSVQESSEAASESAVTESSFEAEVSEEPYEDEPLTLEPEGPVYDPVDPFIVYLSGIDVWGWVGKQSRSDVNILCAVNPQTHQIMLVSTPRDFYVPLSISNGAKDKLTHAGLYGTQCSADTLAGLYGVNIDYTFRVNFSGFEAIVNAVGGITVWTDYDFTVTPIKHYTQGENDLTGLEALAFVRERHSFSQGDRVRGIHQMETVTAVLKKVLNTTWIDNYKTLLEMLTDLYQTTMPMEKLEALAETQILNRDKWEVGTYSADGRGSSGVTYSGGSKALSVIEPDMSTVTRGAELLNAVLEGQMLQDLEVEMKNMD